MSGFKNESKSESRPIIKQKYLDSSGIAILERDGGEGDQSTTPPLLFSDLSSARFHSSHQLEVDIVPKAISSTHTISSNLKYRKKPQRRELSRLNNMVYKKVSKHFLVKSQKGQYKNSFFWQTLSVGKLKNGHFWLDMLEHIISIAQYMCCVLS